MQTETEIIANMRHAAKVRQAALKANSRRIRKAVGLPKFERKCRIINEGKNGRPIKAYKVGGTPEHGEYEYLMARFNEAITHFTE